MAEIISGYYIDVCGSVCNSYFWNRNKLLVLDTGSKGFVTQIEEFDKYILFISNIPDSN